MCVVQEWSCVTSITPSWSSSRKRNQSWSANWRKTSGLCLKGFVLQIIDMKCVKWAACDMCVCVCALQVRYGHWVQRRIARTERQKSVQTQERWIWIWACYTVFSIIALRYQQCIVHVFKLFTLKWRFTILFEKCIACKVWIVCIYNRAAHFWGKKSLFLMYII